MATAQKKKASTQTSDVYPLPVLECRGAAAKSVQAEIVFIHSGSPKSSSYSALLKKLGQSTRFAGKGGQQAFVRFGGRGKAESILFAGLGKTADLTEEKLRSSGGSAWIKLSHEKCGSFAVQLDTVPVPAGSTTERAWTALAEGLVLGAYEFRRHRKIAGDPPKAARITFVTKDKKAQVSFAKVLREVTSMIECVKIARDWSNEPSNFAFPEHLAAECARIGKEAGLKVTILGEKECAREKMGLLLGVGQGADRESQVVVLEYLPKDYDKDVPPVALVGKGVTFDSGGISLKPGLRMEEMKHDMTGASTLFASILLAAKLKLPRRVVAVLGFVENMPGGDAIQPGNVITARNGLTVEVVNTDAEGRLILADMLDYAQDLKVGGAAPAVVINAATLTGAVAIALGKYCGGLMVNDDKLARELIDAGAAHGERLWQLPCFDDYFDDMKTDYADMRNTANDGNGGTIRGGIFLKQFIRKGTRWAHLDIAATAWGITHLSYLPKKGASGLWVRTVTRFIADYRG